MNRASLCASFHLHKVLETELGKNRKKYGGAWSTLARVVLVADPATWSIFYPVVAAARTQELGNKDETRTGRRWGSGASYTLRTYDHLRMQTLYQRWTSSTRGPYTLHFFFSLGRYMSPVSSTTKKSFFFPCFSFFRL